MGDRYDEIDDTYCMAYVLPHHALIATGAAETAVTPRPSIRTTIFDVPTKLQPVGNNNVTSKRLPRVILLVLCSFVVHNVQYYCA